MEPGDLGVFGQGVQQVAEKMDISAGNGTASTQNLPMVVKIALMAIHQSR